MTLRCHPSEFFTFMAVYLALVQVSPFALMEDAAESLPLQSDECHPQDLGFQNSNYV